MNMKKAFAGVLASVVAISAMATTMVSAKNELTYTTDQKAYNKTWDFTGNLYKVTWDNTFKSEFAAASTPTVVTPGSPASVTPTATAGGAATTGSISFSNASTTAYTVDTVINAASFGIAYNPATHVITINTTAASQTILATSFDAAWAAAGIPATLTHTVTGGTGFYTGSSAAVAGTLIAAGVAVPAVPAVMGYTPGNAFAGTAGASTLRFKFTDPTKTEIDSAKLTVTGYKSYDWKDIAGAATNRDPVSGDYFYKDLVTTTYSLTKDGDYWIVKSVANSGNPTSAGTIDLSSFLAITKVEAAYTAFTKKDADGKDLDTKAKADSIADANHEVTLNVDQIGANTSFASIITAMNNRTINSEKGKVGSPEKTHGVTMTGYDVETSAAKVQVAGDWKDGWQAKVVAKDTLYNLTTATNTVGDWNGTYYKNTLSTGSDISDTTAGFCYKGFTAGGKTYNTDDEMKTWAKASLASTKVFGDNTKNNVVKLKELCGAIQDNIGDAKGATLTFSLYTESAAASEKTPDEIKRSGDIAPLSSSSSAEEFCVAINGTASRNYYAKGVAKDGKIVINWDDVTKGLAAGQIFEMSIRIGSGKSFCIDSITVDAPAKTLADLSAGEAAEETTVALDTTAAPAADTTAAAANPTTGNAPIALAVIPVAIIAAAVVAKKRG